MYLSFNKDVFSVPSVFCHLVLLPDPAGHGATAPWRNLSCGAAGLYPLLGTPHLCYSIASIV